MGSNKAKAVLVLMAGLYCVYYFSTLEQWHFIDNVDLIIHEAGHFIFMFLGEFISILGGSLFQLLVPAVFFGYFYYNDQKYSAAAMLLWLALNFFNVGVYAGDALKMELPLLGGENSIHDWNYLLLNTGLIRHVIMISQIIFFSGFVSILGAFWLAWANLDIRQNSNSASR
jgi:hypothetical protein